MPQDDLAAAKELLKRTAGAVPPKMASSRLPLQGTQTPTPMPGQMMPGDIELGAPGQEQPTNMLDNIALREQLRRQALVDLMRKGVR